MPYTAAICALNAKYIHSSLAPWCLAAGVRQYAENVTAHVVEGSINEDENDVLTRILSFAPDAVTFTCYLWNIAETLRLAAAVKAAKPAAFVVLG
ncbi:MAG: B12-binding domain-containing radical SAM protein, partial [Ruthenibacterium sp.]